MAKYRVVWRKYFEWMVEKKVPFLPIWLPEMCCSSRDEALERMIDRIEKERPVYSADIGYEEVK